jgi:putative DNA primase/helicase
VTNSTTPSETPDESSTESSVSSIPQLDFSELTFDDPPEPVTETPSTLKPAGTQQESRCTDLANGQRFAQQWSGKAKYVPQWKAWLVWDGSRWHPDDMKDIFEKAKKTARRIYREAATAESLKDEKAMAAWAVASASRDRIGRMLDMASSDPRIVARASDFDADAYKLNTPAGTIDLRTGKVLPHDPHDLISKITVTSPIEASPVKWLAFLEEIFDGDTELFAYVQRLLGYSLLGTVREHVLPVCWGRGANGKSTLFEAVQELLGDYGAPADPALLMSKRTDAHPTGVADLQGLRFVTCQETGQGRSLDESAVKNLTGGTMRKARKMNCDFFSFKPTDTIWLATNHLPVIRNTDQGIWRRVKLIPFTVEIPPARQDPDLKDKLVKEEGPAILNWLVQGCLAYLQDGLGEVKAVNDATAGYRADMDLIGQFISERCKLDANARAEASDLYAEYTVWAGQSHVRVLDRNAFAREVAEKGYEKKRTKAGVVYLGLVISSSLPEPVVQFQGLSFEELTRSVVADIDRYAA